MFHKINTLLAVLMLSGVAVNPGLIKRESTNQFVEDCEQSFTVKHSLTSDPYWFLAFDGEEVGDEEGGGETDPNDDGDGIDEFQTKFYRRAAAISTVHQHA